MSTSRSFRSSWAPLAAFAAGAVAAAALPGARRTPPPVKAAEPEVRPVRETPPAPESAPAAPAVPRPSPAPPPAAPAAPPPNPPAVEARPPDTRALADELQQLRDQVARLKQDLGQARVDSQTAVLLDVDRHLAGIGTQLVESQARRDEESQAAQRAAAQRDHSVQMLLAANGRLAAGNSDVVDSLDAATAALPYPAQSALQNARERIESKDLYAARYWVGVAILESGWSQIVQ